MDLKDNKFFNRDNKDNKDNIKITASQIKEQMFYTMWLIKEYNNAKFEFVKFTKKDNSLYKKLCDAIQVAKEWKNQDDIDCNAVLELELLKSSIDEVNYEVFRDIYIKIQKKITDKLLNVLEDTADIAELNKLLHNILQDFLSFSRN